MKQTHDMPTRNGETIRPHKFAGKPYPETVEQMCRNLISQASTADLVRCRKRVIDMTSGDLCGMANLLAEYLRDAKGATCQNT